MGPGVQYPSPTFPDPEAQGSSVPRKTAKILAGLRAGARPRDLLGRLQLLLLALGLLSVAGIFPMVLVSRPDLLLFWVLGLMAPPVLAVTWLSSHRSAPWGRSGTR